MLSADRFLLQLCKLRSGIHLPERGRLLGVSTDCRVHRTPGEVSSLRQPSVKCLSVRLGREQWVFGSRLSSSPGQLLRHLHGVAAQECEVVRPPTKGSAIQFARQRLLKYRLGVIQPVERKKVLAEVTVANDTVGFETLRLLGFGHGLLVLPQSGEVAA